MVQKGAGGFASWTFMEDGVNVLSVAVNNLSAALPLDVAGHLFPDTANVSTPTTSYKLFDTN